MPKPKHFLIILLLAVFGGVATATALYHYIVLPMLSIHGEVGVGEPGLGVKPSLIEVRLDIDRPCGVKFFSNIAELVVPENSCIQFKPLLRSIKGSLGLALGGQLLLEPSGGQGATYNISMPCMTAYGLPCYRVQVVIPGYDAPLYIEGGSYKLSLKISWRAMGIGEFIMDLPVLLTTCKGNASIAVIGVEPPSTTGWVVVNGSTRSYSLLLDRVKAKVGPEGYARFTAWAWIFSPGEAGKSVVFFKARIYDEEGHLRGYAIVPAMRKSFYNQVVLEIRLGKGEYVFQLEFPNGRTLEAGLRAE